MMVSRLQPFLGRRISLRRKSVGSLFYSLSDFYWWYVIVAGTKTSWQWHLYDHSQRDSRNLDSYHQQIWRWHRYTHLQSKRMVAPLEVHRSKYTDEWSTCWVISFSHFLVLFFWAWVSVRIASFESPPGGNLYVDLDSSDRASVVISCLSRIMLTQGSSWWSQLKLEWMQGKPVHNWIPQWRLIKSEIT